MFTIIAIISIFSIGFYTGFKTGPDIKEFIDKFRNKQ